jgi:C4-dicarboxylate-specific signal transduction histidine kinase
MPAKNPRINVALGRILVCTATLDGQSFLRVRDSGIGIAPEKMTSLFIPFFSEKGEHAPPGSPQAGVRGVGLSLAVSHSIVTGKGGRIEAESSAGAGSTFTGLAARGMIPCAAHPLRGHRAHQATSTPISSR